MIFNDHKRDYKILSHNNKIMNLCIIFIKKLFKKTQKTRNKHNKSYRKLLMQIYVF